MDASNRAGAAHAMSPSRKPTVERVARFFDQERRGLVAYLRRRVRALEEMDAEDVVSEVALRLFERPDLVDEIENLAGYVMRALQRRVVDWARARKATVALDERRAHDAGR